MARELGGLVRPNKRMSRRNIAEAAREVISRGLSEWWKLHPAVQRAGLFELMDKLRIKIGAPVMRYSAWDIGRKYGSAYCRCPIHKKPVKFVDHNLGTLYSTCSGRKMRHEPLHFLAAYRKCSLEEALVELCKLFPPSNDRRHRPRMDIPAVKE